LAPLRLRMTTDLAGQLAHQDGGCERVCVEGEEGGLGLGGFMLKIRPQYYAPMLPTTRNMHAHYLTHVLAASQSVGMAS